MSDGFGAFCALVLVWLIVGVLPGYLIGVERSFPGQNETWSCTRWENKPNGDCTQYTRMEPSR